MHLNLEPTQDGRARVSVSLEEQEANVCVLPLPCQGPRAVGKLFLFYFFTIT